MVVVVFVGNAPSFPGALPKQQKVKPRGGQPLEPHKGSDGVLQENSVENYKQTPGGKSLDYDKYMLTV